MLQAPQRQVHKWRLQPGRQARSCGSQIQTATTQETSGAWKTASDADSGRIYEYNEATGETRWRDEESQLQAIDSSAVSAECPSNGTISQRRVEAAGKRGTGLTIDVGAESNPAAPHLLTDGSLGADLRSGTGVRAFAGASSGEWQEVWDDASSVRVHRFRM